ncbi:MAG: hypothetical protein JXA57_05015, partial [Armatimonadetes bacterium]|nr:hypothetical protein [Armatimonadota bacterium]
LRRAFDLSREIKDEPLQASVRRELGLLLVRLGAFDEAAKEIDAASRSFERRDDVQCVCVAESDRALRALLMGEAARALEAAYRAQSRARETAKAIFPLERDSVMCGWLLGASLTAFASERSDQRDALLADAERHLADALARCRRIDCVEFEPDVLLAWSALHRARGEPDPARERAREALQIADRCEYRLKQADAQLALARLALDAGDVEEAKAHAEAAKERALCDGPPHHYKPAFDEAARLLAEIGGAR